MIKNLNCKNRRVVVTGMSAVCPLGENLDGIWQKLMNGQSGIGPITLFNPEETNCKIAGEIKTGTEDGQVNLDAALSSSEQKRTDRFIHWALLAAEHAISMAGLKSIKDDKILERIGINVGSGIGGLALIEKTVLEMDEFSKTKNLNNDCKNNPVRNPFFIPASLINLAAGQISVKHGFKGPNLSMVSACATGAHCIGTSAEMIALGDADIMIAGGTEAAICKIGISGFDAMRALSNKYNECPSSASRPWHKERDGFIMGEGAGILVLEEYEHAKARGATILAEITGYGMSGDAHHISAPHPCGEGGRRAMQIALRNAGLSIEQLDYLNAHGTSTPAGDLIELRAIAALFEQAQSSQLIKNLAISSTKSSIGHLLGAAGAVEAVFAILSIMHNQIPPTLNIENTEDIEPEALEFNLIHANNPSNKYFGANRQIKRVASNSFGFGGTNACLIFEKAS